MTESLSTDEKTVAEKAYMLNDSSTIVYRVNGQEVDTVTDRYTSRKDATLRRLP